MRANYRRWLGCLLVVAIVALVLGVLYLSMFGYYGVGSFPQEVVLDSDRPIVKASYASTWRLSEDERHQAETAADPTRLFHLEAATLEGDRFTSVLQFTTGPRDFQRPHYLPELVVVVEFADGTQACRVVEVPKGMGKEPITVRFR